MRILILTKTVEVVSAQCSSTSLFIELRKGAEVVVLLPGLCRAAWDSRQRDGTPAGGWGVGLLTLPPLLASIFLRGAEQRGIFLLHGKCCLLTEKGFVCSCHCCFYSNCRSLAIFFLF